jgi:hypothetical protein
MKKVPAMLPHAHCAPELRAPGREKHPLVPVENRQKQISSAELIKYKCLTRRASAVLFALGSQASEMMRLKLR